MISRAAWIGCACRHSHCMAREPLFLLVQEKGRKEGHPDALAARPCDSPLARQGVRGLALRLELLGALKRRGCLWLRQHETLKGCRRYSVSAAVNEGFAPFRLASRPAAGRGRSDRDVAPRLAATRRRVEPAPSQPSVVRLRGRTPSGLEGPKGQAVGCPSFRVFSWTSKKIPSHAAHGDQFVPHHLTGVRNPPPAPERWIATESSIG